MQSSLEGIELRIETATLQEALAESRGTTATPKRVERNVGIARFLRRHAHERYRTSRSEADAGDVLLFRRINDLKARLHAR